MNNKEKLEFKFAAVKAMREFFWSRGFSEIETPCLVRCPGQEPYLSPMRTIVHDEHGQSYKMYLHTSPEFAMKKMLAAGFDKIFYLGKCFRDFESFGGLHNPEFTMLEWYRTGVDYRQIMDETEKMFKFVVIKMKNHRLLSSANARLVEKKWSRVSMRDLWRERVGVDLNDVLSAKKMAALCRQKGFSAAANERYEDLFYKIFLNKIEPRLGLDAPTIVHNYPASMAALARLSKQDKRYAERFELYFDGLELANAFSELTDAREQARRLRQEQRLRKKLGQEVFPIDKEFINALKSGLPECAGIALGVDRFVQILLGCREINNVLSLPMKRLIEDN
ncbi:EF-P lysine aminoacylase GenX [Candidatus Falkowbacteria bacterium]|nr:EF-P lysine aminoacylase GenX [Candidatus Falkowbacteria bacterium]